MAGDLWYSFRVAVVIAAGTVWSRPPAISSSGPRGGEVGQGVLEQGLAGGGHGPAVEEIGGLLLSQRVAEAVAELRLRQRHGLLPVGRSAQGDRGDPQRRRGQVVDAFDGGRVDRHARGGQVLPEQPLHDEDAEGVPDDDGRRAQPPDDPGVVLDHVVDALPGDLLRLAPGLLDGVGGARPAGCDRRVPRLLEELDPRAPRCGVQPQAVHEDNGGICWRHLVTFRRCGRAPRVPGRYPLSSGVHLARSARPARYHPSPSRWPLAASNRCRRAGSAPTLMTSPGCGRTGPDRTMTLLPGSPATCP